MNLIGTKVNHKTFGDGTIIALDDTAGRITVQFPLGVKIFGYPQCFKPNGYLQFEDKTLEPAIAEIIEANDLKIQQQKEAEEARRQERAKNNILKNAKNTPRKYPRRNIAFKCTYCNGGKNETCFGFNGLCSDTQMDYNVNIRKYTWCSAKENPCRMYLEGKITKSQLEDKYNRDNASVCYESNLLRAWRYGAGMVVRGKNKGKPNTLRGVQTNSLCVLTTRKPNTNKKQRYIFGVFFVIRSEEGDEISEGKVIAHPKYRIALSDSEAEKMCFWNYYQNNSNIAPFQWGAGLFRYLDDKTAIRILQDIQKIKKTPEDRGLIDEMIEYFYSVNKL